jgi:hypothetical protein
MTFSNIDSNINSQFKAQKEALSANELVPIASSKER